MTKEKNSIIELLRFIFALNVVKNHGYFPYQGSYFSPGTISVEFFFVLSGFLFVKSLVKYNDKSLFKNIFSMYKSKIIALGIPLAVGLFFNLIYSCIVGFVQGGGILGYLWYVHDMLIVFAIYIILKRIVKNDKAFWIIVAITALLASIAHAIPYCYSWGIIRALAAISLGMLVTKIPKINNKIIVSLGFALSSAAALRMLLFNFVFIEEEILNIIVYPALVYFTFQIPFSNKAFNYLGSISFGLYAYQSIPRLINQLGYANVWLDFIIIVACSILTSILTIVLKHKKQKGSL